MIDENDIAGVIASIRKAPAECSRAPQGQPELVMWYALVRISACSSWLRRNTMFSK